MDILIWLGSGFAFAIGVVSGVWIMRAATKPDKEWPGLKANELLAKRNEIGLLQAEALCRIAIALEDANARAEVVK